MPCGSPLAANTHAATRGTTTMIVGSHAENDGAWRPLVGSPITTNTTSDSARSPDHRHSCSVSRRCATRAAIGSANSSVVTRSGCTSSRLPTAERGGLHAEPRDVGGDAQQPDRPVHQRGEEPGAERIVVRDPHGAALLEHGGPREQERRDQRQRDGKGHEWSEWVT